MKAMQISLSGMDVELRRMEVIAENIANANTVRTAGGEPYRAMRLVSGPRAGFASLMQEPTSQDSMRGVMVYGVEPQNLPSRRVYEPGNPQADDQGYVDYPGFDHAGEMVELVKSSRVYEANMVAMNIAREMYLKAVELGKAG
jgi:flagellar basal-body rod protein FlgC